MPDAYVGIGSNLGDRAGNCLSALDLLKRKGIKIITVSHPYETKPWGVEAQPDFINMAARVEADIPTGPMALLETIFEVESEMGRVRKEKWGPRIIDLDILLYGDEIIDLPGLKVPHPLMHLREFVLRPLSEIAPEAVHPVLKKTIAQLLSELTGNTSDK